MKLLSIIFLLIIIASCSNSETSYVYQDAMYVKEITKNGKNCNILIESEYTTKGVYGNTSKHYTQVLIKDCNCSDFITGQYITIVPK